MSSSNLNRRAILAGASTVPVLMLTNASRAAGAADDAELVALGSELEARIREWLGQRRIYQQEQDQIEAEVERLTGMKYDDVKDDIPASYQEIRTEVVFRFTADCTDENCPWNDIGDRTWPLVRRILLMRATTMAGLAIQARAASFENAEWWDHPDMMESWDIPTKGLIESLCAYTGVVPVVLELQS